VTNFEQALAWALRSGEWPAVLSQRHRPGGAIELDAAAIQEATHSPPGSDAGAEGGVRGKTCGVMRLNAGVLCVFADGTKKENRAATVEALLIPLSIYAICD